MLLAASFYIIVCSAKNRVIRRLRRLREPRYLVGAIVGAAYLYFSFFARMRGARGARSRRGAPGLPSGLMQAGGAIASVVFLCAAALAWLLPFNSGLLDFSNAEIDFLFVAPVSRRALLVHRLMRSQLGLLFTAVVSSLFYPSAAGGRVRWVIAMWVVLTTSRVYFTGVTLARTRLTTLTSRRMAWAPIAGLVAAGAGVGAPRLHPVVGAPLAGPGAAGAGVAPPIVHAFVGQPPAGVDEALSRFERALSSGPAATVLWPFVALTRPLFAPWFAPFFTALAGAVVVLAVVFVWVLRADEALQEAATDAAEKRAAQTRSRRTPTVRARATGLTLAPRGRPEYVFFWKNGVQTLRLGGLTMVRIVVATVAVVTAVSSVVLRVMQLRGGAAAVCSIAMASAAFAAILGPQVVRTDLRSDLQHLDVLKTWPVGAASVIRGEMLWPGVMLTGIGWLAIACALMLSIAAFPEMSAATRITSAVAAALVMPALVFAQYLVQNAAAMLFPAWVPLGDQRPRGLDAMGQRLIMLGGVMLSVLLMFVPGAVAAGVVWLAFQRWLGVAAFIPAAGVCATIVGLEVLAATQALGPLYEKLDVLAVERAE
jgi:ABC-2 type transport system permease protein